MVPVFIYTALFLMIFILVDILYHRFKINVDYTRKVAHVLSGIVALTFTQHLEFAWQISVMSISFFVLLFVSEYKKWFKGITAVKRKSKGSWLFVTLIWICFMAYLQSGKEQLFLIPIAVLSFSDTAAFLIGKSFPIKKYYILSGQKSLGGFMAFLLCTVIIFFVFPFQYGVIFIITTSLVAAVIEGVTVNGWDNLTAPMSVTLSIYLCEYYQWLS